MNIGQLDGQPLALQIFNGMTAESTCVNERWAKDQLFRCVCFAGGRHQTILDETVGPIFQSTSSVWRTTEGQYVDLRYGVISIHVLRVEDDGNVGFKSITCCISIHVLRVEDDEALLAAMPACVISIHVLRVEDDTPRRYTRPNYSDFNPRPPCGGRRYPQSSRTQSYPFQSTSSVWRTTKDYPALIAGKKFQSTSSVWRTTQQHW